MKSLSFDKLTSPGNRDAFQMFLDTIPVLVYVYQGDKVVYVNKTVEKTLGYTFEEMTQKNFWDICHPDYKELVKERGRARLRGENVPSNYEFKILKKDGQAIWVDVFFARTELSGAPISIVGAYDVTEKKQLQEKLQQAYEEMETCVLNRTEELRHAINQLTLLNDNLTNVLSNMSDGVLIIDENVNCEVLNPVLQHIWGDLLEQIYQRIRDDILNYPYSFIHRMLFEKVPFQDEEIILSTSKGSVHFLASGTPITDPKNKLKQGVLIIRPIKDVHRLVNRFTGSQAKYTFEDIITCNPKMLNLINQARNASISRSNILIQGESGTGKEMFAQAVHKASNRRNGPFIAVNCGAIPRDLVGSELFGYVEGAFTGAKKEGKPGKFELASGGTLFLDEIGDMPFEQQVVLLRVIQDKAVTRIGGKQAIPVDVRIICATNKNLINEVNKGNFRIDLYYRLNVISINIPPLRERPEDIPLLYKYFLTKMIPELKNYEIDSELIAKLQSYAWPGNVRELENIVERMLYQSQGDLPLLKHLPEELFSDMATPILPYNEDNSLSLLEARKKQRQELVEIEKQQLIDLLYRCKGNISQIAREMGLARSTVYKKMREYNIK